MKYLSLFSGIEAATVAWEALGFEPVAFAEFEDFPKAVLAHHYPNVPDLGDVTKITKEQIIALGHIDIVVGGSPCQDLSIAGKRAGMKNEDGSTTRSGLFDEQMRIFEIAKEFCGARYLLWENVPGAFSSNNGLDFAYVLGSMVGGSIPVPTDRWKNSGVAVSGNGLRIVEWRVLDAQNFGVPQRRRRIFALLDTGAWWSRQPILFEQEGVPGHSTQSRGKGEGIADGAEGSVGESCIPINTMAVQGRPSDNGRMGIGIGKNGDPAPTLSSAHHHAVAVRTAQTVANGQAVCYENHANDSRVTRCEDGIVPTLSSRMGTGGGNVPFVMATGQINAEILKDKCPTLNCAHEQPIYFGAGEKTFTLSTVDNMRICMEEKVSVIEMGALVRGQGNRAWNDCAPTLRAEMGDNQPCVMMEEKVMAFAQNTRDEVRYQNGDGQIVGALAANPGMKQTTYIQTNTVVRRLTPVECERLQGFPDNYTNIPWANKATAPDSRRYKALGNSMAVPVMRWIGKRMLEAKQVVCDEDLIDTILYGTPSDGGQLSLF